MHKLLDLKIEAEVKKIKKLAVTGKSKNAILGDGRGLYLQISKAGAASFIFRYMRSGKAMYVGLGAYPATSLKKARGEHFPQILRCNFSIIQPSRKVNNGKK